MIQILPYSETNLEKIFARVNPEMDVTEIVRQIISEVRKHGDAALIEYCQRKGNPVIYHNCGRAMELIPGYRKMGAANIEPWSPKPLGNCDLDEVAKQVSGEFSITSGVDQVNVIQKGTVEDVRNATLAAISKGKQFPAFILQNVDFLEFGTPLENVAEFVKVGLENACYE